MVTPINVGKNGVDNAEWNQIKDELSKLKGDEKLQVTDGSKTIEYGREDLQNLSQNALNQAFSANADNATPDAAKAKQAQAELDKIVPEMDALQKAIEEAKKNGLKEEVYADKVAKLKELIDQANKAMKNGAKAINMKGYNKAAGLKDGQKLMSGKAQIAMGGQQAQASQAGAKAQSATGGYSPASWGAQTWGGSSGVPMFSTDAYMKTMAMESNIQSSWDSVNKNTNRGKQLMMLFFYFAKMAESGSMDSMYQFMKFITYIISKDKAKQQIEMGKKLIQLQELSRSWTNKLLNVSTDSSDPSASNELMKTMTIVKSETDAIATSQKLISQMMEEFAQVVETLTNTTKAALETAGRIKRTVSTMR